MNDATPGTAPVRPMRLSEKPIDDLRVGDEVTSKIGNHGVIAHILHDEVPDLFGRTSREGARILILWHNQKWSMVDHLVADAISMGRLAHDNYARTYGDAEDEPMVVIDGGASLRSAGLWDAIHQDVRDHWPQRTPVVIVGSSDDRTTIVSWSGTARDLSDETIDGLDKDREVLGDSIDELVMAPFTALVYTDGRVEDRSALAEALRGRPHELMLMVPEGSEPDPEDPVLFEGLRVRTVRYQQPLPL
jgi:hypothetical protein